MRLNGAVSRKIFIFKLAAGDGSSSKANIQNCSILLLATTSRFEISPHVTTCNGAGIHIGLCELEVIYFEYRTYTLLQTQTHCWEDTADIG
jgi:hypothetical protein